MKDRYFEFEQVNGATLNNALDKIDELTAKLDKAKEAFDVIVDWTKDGYACHIAETALKELNK